MHHKLMQAMVEREARSVQCGTVTPPLVGETKPSVGGCGDYPEEALPVTSLS
jgi:hypothetical protein